MNEIKNKNVFIRVSENEKISLNATLKNADFPYRNISVSELWDICREQSTNFQAFEYRLKDMGY